MGWVIFAVLATIAVIWLSIVANVTFTDVYDRMKELENRLERLERAGK